MTLIGKLIWNELAISWFAIIVLSATSLFGGLSGDHPGFTALFQFAGYFFLAAETVYHSLIVRALTCREIFQMQSNESFCFSALLLSLVFWIDFGCEFFSGFIGTIKLFMIVLAVILYFAAVLFVTQLRLYATTHY